MNRKNKKYKTIQDVKKARAKSDRPSHTDQQLNDFMMEHFPYEVEMLRALHAELQTADRRVKHHAKIEAFAIHARNLVEFFARRSQCDFNPSEFTEFDHPRSPRSEIVPIATLDKIDEQVSHFSERRVVGKVGKLGPADWDIIIEALNKEISRFEQALHSNWKQRYLTRDQMDLTSNAVGACNYVTVVSSVQSSTELVLHAGGTEVISDERYNLTNILQKQK